MSTAVELRGVSKSFRRTDGGARFSIELPAETQAALPAEQAL